MIFDLVMGAKSNVTDVAQIFNKWLRGFLWVDRLAIHMAITHKTMCLKFIFAVKFFPTCWALVVRFKVNLYLHWRTKTVWHYAKDKVASRHCTHNTELAGSWLIFLHINIHNIFIFYVKTLIEGVSEKT